MDPYGSTDNEYETSGHQMGVDVDNIMENVTNDSLMEELLDQLPSKQMERVVELASQTLKKRKTSVVHTKSLRRREKHTDLEIFNNLRDTMDEDGFNDDLDNDALRNIPTTLSRKRHIKRQIPKTETDSRIGRCRHLQYQIGMMLQHFKDYIKSAAGLFDLWRSHLLIIEGYFGTSVVSYFIFLQWVLFINIPLFLVTAGFLVFPQLLYRFNQKEPRGYEDSKSITGKELLTGTGFFEQTEMYYGFYTNETVGVIAGTKYQMKYAYLLTCAGYYLSCFIILGYVYLRSYRKYYIESSGNQFGCYNIVFSGWDYGITNHETSVLKFKSIHNEMKESLSRKKFMVGDLHEHLNWKGIMIIRLQRIFVWFIVVSLLATSGYVTYVTSVELSLATAVANETTIPMVSTMAMPVVISCLHFVIPMIFTFLEAYETYSQPKYELYIHMFRDMALKSTMLGTLIYFWFDVAAAKVECWETFIGQEIYRLVIVDLFFTLAYSFFMEFVRKLFSLKWNSIERSEFAVGRHTLELIYSQSLCWFGVFFSPLLPVIMILKLIIIFYVKRYSAVANCKSSMTMWRASNTHTIFMGYLFFVFIMCFAAASCAIFLIEPSTSCGPYKNYETSYEVIELLVGDWKSKSSSSRRFFDFIASPGLMSLYLIILSVVLYFMRTVMMSHRTVVDQLRTQMLAEGRDKRFLINLLNQIKERGRRISRHTGPQLVKAIELSAIQTKGKIFTRHAAEAMQSPTAH